MNSLGVVVVMLMGLSAILANPAVDIHEHLDQADLTDATEVTTLFKAWEGKHSKHVSFKNEAERSKAYDTLLENAKKIRQHREEHRAGLHSYTLGLNQFSHMTFDEFKATRMGHSKQAKAAGIYPSASRAPANRKRRAIPPPSVDWAAAGYTTPPKDQGNCGCCWTFATTGGLEGAYFKKTGKLISLSEQQLVECVQGITGCDGGAAAMGIDYIHSTGSIATEQSYGYTSGNGAYSPSCGAAGKASVALSPTYTDVPHADDTALMNALASTGPVPTTVALKAPFMNYVSGIMDPSTACDDPSLVNHAVLLTGYGTEAATGKKYWIVKNSWGPTWGEKGYFRVSRDVPNACGLSTEAISVTVA